MRTEKFPILAMTAAVLFGTLAGCRQSSPKAETDQEIEKAIVARIESHPRLRSYNITVDADAERNHVTISGTVPTQDLRLAAVAAAKEGQADRVIEVQINVDPSAVSRADYSEEMAANARAGAKRAGEKLGEDLEDAWIHTRIRAKLVGQGELPFGGVSVDVVKGVVTLRGSVESPQAKAEAERIARETGGVEEVRNQLVVKPRG